MQEITSTSKTAVSLFHETITWSCFVWHCFIGVTFKFMRTMGKLAFGSIGAFTIFHIIFAQRTLSLWVSCSIWFRMSVCICIGVLFMVTTASGGIREYFKIVLGVLSLSYFIHLDIIYLLYAIFLSFRSLLWKSAKLLRCYLVT